jgi:para-nitrobenzyl esterase
MSSRWIVLTLLLLAPHAQAAVESGLWYDRMHNGHGLDLHRAGPLLFGTFYTYDARNAVDWLWLQSTDLDSPSSDLRRFRRTPAGMVNSVVGDIALTPVSDCPDGLPRADARALLRMEFTVEGTASTWCLEPLLPLARPPLALLAGSWYAPDDPGWGVMSHDFVGADGTAQSFRIIYFHDSAGDPRWAFATGGGDHLTQTQTYYTPYVECRGCPSVPFLSVPIGRATLTLTAPLHDADPVRNRVSMDLDFEGSRFRRDAALALLSTPLRVVGAAATREGPLVGRVLDAGIEVLHDVPYAKAPVGELRWRAPQTPLPRTRLRDARAPGDACPQLPDGPLPMSEDCLQLNVWRPASSGPHPVMLWIHGGGFVAGSAVQTDGRLLYDGAAFARHGVVFVSINYRLGALGFLAQRDLVGAAPDHPQSGNYGLLDQIAALAWVRDNIAGFGGDPAQVTLFGESAGGVSSCALLTAPAARGLFQRVIVQSGNCGWDPPSLATGLAQGDRVAAAAGCSNAADRRGCLRALSPAQLLAAAPPIIDPANLIEGERFGPVIDGFVLAQAPGRAIAAGNAAAVPLLIGVTDDETTSLVATSLLPATVAGYESAIRARFAAIGDEVLQRYPAAAYPTPQRAYQDLLDDVLFACPARRAAADHAAHDNPVFHYALTEILPDPGFAAMESFHGLDVLLLFGDLAAAPPAVRELGARMQRSWIDFAAGRWPGSSDAIDWPRYRMPARLSLEINSARAPLLDDYRREHCEFWNRYLVL